MQRIHRFCAGGELAASENPYKLWARLLIVSLGKDQSTHPLNMRSILHKWESEREPVAVGWLWDQLLSADVAGIVSWAWFRGLPELMLHSISSQLLNVSNLIF